MSGSLGDTNVDDKCSAVADDFCNAFQGNESTKSEHYIEDSGTCARVSEIGFEYAAKMNVPYLRIGSRFSQRYFKTV